MKNNYIIITSLSFFYSSFVLSEDLVNYQISVNHNVKIDCAITQPILELKATNKYYNTIESEISRIKSLKDKSDEVSLDENQSIVSILYNEINQAVSKSIKLAKIAKMPKLVLYVGSDPKTYNASAQTSVLTSIETTTKRTKSGKLISTEVNKTVEKKYKRVVGEGVVKLLLWKDYGSKLLASIIAHEVGHMCDSVMGESKRAEYFAESKAIEFVGKKDAKMLCQAIDMITLASHMYNILTLNSYLLRLNLGDAHQVIRIIVNSMVNELPELGDLGQCSTHKKFGYVVNKIFQDSLKYSLDPRIGMTEREFVNVYQRLHSACANLSEYIGPENEQEISEKYEFIENYTNQIYNHITHPTPLERSNNIQNCISKLA